MHGPSKPLVAAHQTRGASASTTRRVCVNRRRGGDRRMGLGRVFAGNRPRGAPSRQPRLHNGWSTHASHQGASDAGGVRLYNSLRCGQVGVEAVGLSRSPVGERLKRPETCLDAACDGGTGGLRKRNFIAHQMRGVSASTTRYVVAGARCRFRRPAGHRQDSAVMRQAKFLDD